MDEETKKKLMSEEGMVFDLQEHHVIVRWEGPVTATFFSKHMERNGRNADLTESDTERLIEDLRDLSDWRHYRRLQNKLNAK